MELKKDWATLTGLDTQIRGRGRAVSDLLAISSGASALAGKQDLPRPRPASVRRRQRRYIHSQPAQRRHLRRLIPRPVPPCFLTTQAYLTALGPRIRRRPQSLQPPPHLHCRPTPPRPWHPHHPMLVHRHRRSAGARRPRPCRRQPQPGRPSRPSRAPRRPLPTGCSRQTSPSRHSNLGRRIGRSMPCRRPLAGRRPDCRCLPVQIERAIREPASTRTPQPSRAGHAHREP